MRLWIRKTFRKEKHNYFHDFKPKYQIDLLNSPSLLLNKQSITHHFFYALWNLFSFLPAWPFWMAHSMDLLFTCKVKHHVVSFVLKLPLSYLWRKIKRHFYCLHIPLNKLNVKALIKSRWYPDAVLQKYVYSGPRKE